MDGAGAPNREREKGESYKCQRIRLGHCCSEIRAKNLVQLGCSMDTVPEYICIRGRTDRIGFRVETRVRSVCKAVRGRVPQYLVEGSGRIELDDLDRQVMSQNTQLWPSQKPPI